MSSEVSSIQGKSISSKNIITYSLVLLTFLVALWLSFQSEGPHFERITIKQLKKLIELKNM